MAPVPAPKVRRAKPIKGQKPDPDFLIAVRVSPLEVLELEALRQRMGLPSRSALLRYSWQAIAASEAD